MAIAAKRNDEGFVSSYTVTVDGEDFLVAVEDGTVISVNGESAGSLQIHQVSQHVYLMLSGGSSLAIAAAGSGGKLDTIANGCYHHVQVVSERERTRKQLRSASHVPLRMEVRAPMPALVVKIEVSEGDTVREGQGLVILEAMKMENEIRAHAAGKVKEIYITAGEAVEKDGLLILLE